MNVSKPTPGAALASPRIDTAVGERKRKRRRGRTEAWYGYLFVSPMVIGYALFLLGPIATAFAMSLTDWSLLRELSFVGLDNYRQAFAEDPVFWITVRNTLYFAAGLVPLNLLLALLLALLLKGSLPGMGLFRTAIFTPVVTSVVVWSVVWKYMLATDAGLFNQLLGLFGVKGPAWLYDMDLAMPVVIVVSVLKNVGLNMVIFLAALHDVPKMYEEAAVIDGASRWKRLTRVTLPMISPAVFLALVLTLIGSLKAFGQIYVLTGGGPGTSTHVLVYYIYHQAFKLYEFGYASAIAFLLFVLTLLLTIVQWTVRKRWVFHET
ncbi:carbohydrate ABC transporter permease [Paenibacillus flagellatus]|uniref:Sugar ABC transporter permease n=1 Tax=Paenibacillus flagellatus TaxID=2211139 RepID=A0A2V5KQ91_9BACL|nr:sugar ABC transporter permease [Paenibacillus flagellatus]PYI53447.1 sugar ABC transporter permease [Paenibacillus flagellatus]